MAGDPSHFELGVPLARKAKAFYGELFGWSFHTTTGDNAWIETGGVRGGLHDSDDASNIVVYFRVPDIEAAVKLVRELGGEAGEPGPAGESGRFTSCRDDQGVEFGLHEPAAAMPGDWDWKRVVFDHVHIRVRSAAESIAFYKTVLEPLAIPPLWEHDDGAQFANLVVSDDAEPGGPIHIAFVADSREQVDAFHRVGIEGGCRDNGTPGVREQYSSDAGGRYYAAFLLDPDGNNVEAVHRDF